MKLNRGLIGLLLTGILLTGCTNTMEQGLSGSRSNMGTGAGTGALGGAAAGALAGQLIGGDTRATLIGAAIGAGVGTVTGLSWGASRDRQEAELRNALAGTGVTVGRSGEFILMTLPGSATFDSGSANISPTFFGPLNSITNVLVKYPESRVVVNGHTDSTGSLSTNMTLSQQRAMNVATYFTSRGVAGNRVAFQGLGPNQPIADNGTPQGRALNRRVEIFIMPNDRR